mmetsp:Transcript_86222/g.136974  ORF Transcript_86222/g.136974 Transcript_86222/m.136974 type:complete len:222 (-) Transcript_86222:37-702(-)
MHHRTVAITCNVLVQALNVGGPRHRQAGGLVPEATSVAVKVNPKLSSHLWIDQVHKGVAKRQLADELHGQVEEVIGSTESGIIQKLLEVLNGAALWQVFDHHTGPVLVHVPPLHGLGGGGAGENIFGGDPPGRLGGIFHVGKLHLVAFAASPSKHRRGGLLTAQAAGGHGGAGTGVLFLLNWNGVEGVLHDQIKAVRVHGHHEDWSNPESSRGLERESRGR